MADTPSTKKRLVKNPETFRERAVKTAAENEQPGKASRARSGIARPFKLVWRPIGRALVWLAHMPPFRWLRKPLKFIGRIIFPKYFRSSLHELRLVKWPSWSESRRLTYAVLAFAVVFGVLVAVVDYGLDKLFREVLLK